MSRRKGRGGDGVEGTDLHDGFGGYLSVLFEQMVTNLISKTVTRTNFGIDNNSRSVEKTSTLLVYKRVQS